MNNTQEQEILEENDIYILTDKTDEYNRNNLFLFIKLGRKNLKNIRVEHILSFGKNRRYFEKIVTLKSYMADLDRLKLGNSKNESEIKEEEKNFLSRMKNIGVESGFVTGDNYRYMIVDERIVHFGDRFIVLEEGDRSKGTKKFGIYSYEELESVVKMVKKEHIMKKMNTLYN